MARCWMLGCGIVWTTLIFTLGGCAATPRLVPLASISCHYTFNDLETQAERDRVAAAIKKYAKDGVITPVPDPASSSPEYMFVVDRLAVLDQLHAELLYSGVTTGQQRLNFRGPSFGIHYEAANLGATIEVIVHFHVTPGAQLFYKPQGESEKDISGMVDNAGDVTLKTMIHKNEDFIYARINSGNIDKYIRINIYTQQVENIPSGAY